MKKLRNHVHSSDPSWAPGRIGVGQAEGWEATAPLQGPSSTIKGLGQEPKRWLSPQEVAGRAPATSMRLIFHWERLNHLRTCDSSASSSAEAHLLSRTSRLVLKLSRHVSMCCTSRHQEQPSCSQQAPGSLFLASGCNSFKLLWGNSYPDFIRSGRPFYFLSVFSTQRTGSMVNFISMLAVF